MLIEAHNSHPSWVYAFDDHWRLVPRAFRVGKFGDFLLEWPGRCWCGCHTAWHVCRDRFDYFMSVSHDRYPSWGIEVRVCGQPHLSSLIGKRVGFPGFHFSPTKTKHKKWNNPKEILCMPSEPPMLPFISDICLASASWTSSYCLFITCFALITCSWWWRRRRWWDGAGDGPAEKSDSHTYWNYCFIIISKEFWPTLEC